MIRVDETSEQPSDIDLKIEVPKKPRNGHVVIEVPGRTSKRSALELTPNFATCPELQGKGCNSVRGEDSTNLT